MEGTGKKVLAVAGGILGTALVIWPVAVWLQVRNCEKPKYKTLLTLGNSLRSFYDRKPAIEIRQYSPYIIAEVSIEAENMKEATEKGFRQVAGFIFGGNKGDEKISMTSPVQSEHQGQAANGAKQEEGEKIAMTVPVTTEMEGNRYKVAFVMPSKYSSVSELPKPNNAAVQLKQIEGHTLAAISWRGSPRPTQNIVKDKEKELRAALKEANISTKDGDTSTKLYQYYPPFAPQWIRLQDVLLPVDKALVNRIVERDSNKFSVEARNT